jgi:hypothetical protein
MCLKAFRLQHETHSLRRIPNSASPEKENASQQLDELLKNGVQRTAEIIRPLFTSSLSPHL